jgi:hypothetical protein
MITLRKMSVLAGIAILAGVAGATPISKDTQILIDRALNSPTLTVRYSGATATLVEFRLNGESIGTRAISTGKNSGETTFNLNLNDLKDGDNDVEIRLYDKRGNLVGREKSKISTEQSAKGPVYLETPKVGAVVQGPVELKVGFGKSMKNINVSFFIDNNWKSLINNPPFAYLWDTSRETNGWHEVEAWVVDESSATFKTKKTRILVNNPGGRTERPVSNGEATPATNAVNTTVVGEGAGVRKIEINAKGSTSTTAKATAPKVTRSLDTQQSPVRVNVESNMVTTKPIDGGAGLAMGVRNVVPPRVVAKKANKPVMEINRHNESLTVANSYGLIPVVRGQRIPNLTGNFAILLDRKSVV